MTVYSFFIICNTNCDLDFHIECTSMADYRLRFSAMKSAYKQKLRQNKFNENEKNVNTFLLSIHSKSNEYNVCDKCENENENDNVSPAYKLHNLFRRSHRGYQCDAKGRSGASHSSTQAGGETREGRTQPRGNALYRTQEDTTGPAPATLHAMMTPAVRFSISYGRPASLSSSSRATSLHCTSLPSPSPPPVANPPLSPMPSCIISPCQTSPLALARGGVTLSPLAGSSLM